MNYPVSLIASALVCWDSSNLLHILNNDGFQTIQDFSAVTVGGAVQPNGTLIAIPSGKDGIGNPSPKLNTFEADIVGLAGATLLDENGVVFTPNAAAANGALNLSGGPPATTIQKLFRTGVYIAKANLDSVGFTAAGLVNPNGFGGFLCQQVQVSTITPATPVETWTYPRAPYALRLYRIFSPSQTL